MKFELRAASFDDEFKKTVRLPDGKYDILKVKFKDIKSVHVYLETEVRECLNGYQQEINTWFVDINTLEDLMALKEEVDHDLIVGIKEIVIYDDYVE